MATRDRLALLRRAVTAILEQDYDGDIDCVVVFDQSEPEQLDVPTSSGRTITTMRNTRTSGLPGARNSGILACTGELVAFCDDDDEWLPGKLAQQVALLGGLPETPLVSCGIVVAYDGHEVPRPAPAHPLQFEDFLRDRIMAVHPSTVLMRRSMVLDRIGLVDEEIPGGYGEDYEFLLRTTQAGPIHCVPAELVRVNWHAASYFFDRWRTIISALDYLLARYPQFQGSPLGLARIQGQLAFAYAGMGERRQARRYALRALANHWQEQRAWVSLAISLRLLTNDQVAKLAHRSGRGI